MSWLDRLLRRGPVLSTAQREALDGYRRLPAPSLAGPFAARRVVVVDVEATGLDPFHDRLISIGAVAVDGGQLRLGDAFETVLRQERPSAVDNILVHGIAGSVQLGGCEAADGLLDFLAFAGKGPLVAWRADFDRVLIERALRSELRERLANSWLDLALLAPALLGGDGRGTLDEWLKRYGIENYQRHDALADALATAQLLMVVVAAAQRRGISSWSQLADVQSDQRWLDQMRRGA